MERLYIIAYAFCLVTASYRQKARFQWGERRRKGASQKVFGSEKNWELLVHKLSAPFLGPAFKGLCLTCRSRLLLCLYPPIPRASATSTPHLSAHTSTHVYDNSSAFPLQNPQFILKDLAQKSSPQKISLCNQCPLSGTPVLWPASNQTSIIFAILSFFLTT